MSQIGNNVYPNTTFPDSVQTLPTFTNLATGSQTIYLKYLKAILDGDFEEASAFLSMMPDNSIISASKLNTISDTISAIQEVFSTTDTFLNVINAKQSEWQSIINKFRYDGECNFEYPDASWKSDKVYSIGEDVLYSSKAWRSKVNNNINYAPSDNSIYWEPIFRKYALLLWNNNLWLCTNDLRYVPSDLGSNAYQLTFKGDKGNNGDSFNFYESWDSTYSYIQGDLVVYDESAYLSIMDNNLNHLPNEEGSIYWRKEFDFVQQHIPVQSTEPTSQQEGDLWFKIIN